VFRRIIDKRLESQQAFCLTALPPPPLLLLLLLLRSAEHNDDG